MRRVVLWGCLVLALCAVAAPAWAQRRMALVIGNGAYPSAPLKNPVNDADALGAKLKALGFEVETRTDLGLRDMTRAVTAFGNRLKQQGGGIALFYYAGHGMQVAGRNYLIPVDAEITSESSVRSESIDVDSVMAQLGEANGEINLVILDACRNNPYERRFRGGGAGLAAIDAPRGTLVAYATAPGRTAADGEGSNGLYTGTLLRVIGESGLRAEDVFKRVRAEVARQTGDAQVPWEMSSLTGDFYFVPKGSTVTIAPPGTAPTAPPAVSGFDERQIELAVWDAVKGSSKVADFEDYLARYPKGVFASFAKRRIEELKAPPPAALSKAPTKDTAAAPPTTPAPPPAKAGPQVAAVPPAGDDRAALDRTMLGIWNARSALRNACLAWDGKLVVNFGRKTGENAYAGSASELYTVRATGACGIARGTANNGAIMYDLAAEVHGSDVTMVSTARDPNTGRPADRSTALYRLAGNTLTFVRILSGDMTTWTSIEIQASKK